ncbi:1-acyl-sn-glycerol-3-phosphate acyltransferase [invertebrate metagenome]|uniref:1-acyl-sn-glycerol-3-phosphate acyltransferase n=1 Tax=invertebrate metagenome TaxID=1711999 RepID=A0A2H9T908_9ZZZZ
MSDFFMLIRNILFYTLLILWTLVWTTVSFIPVCLLPLHKRHRFLVMIWCWVAIWLCRWTCGLRWKIHGQENLPAKTCVIISNHQSAWETFFLQTLITPQTQVLKRELTIIPFFGWALRLTHPIAIDRSNVRLAIQQVRKQGLAALKKNISVLVFPEGTRNPCGKLGKFSRGGASLAITSGKDVIPVAHNAGKFWPRKGLIKTPGTIDVFIGPVINIKGRSPADITTSAREWIDKALS